MTRHDPAPLYATVAAAAAGPGQPAPLFAALDRAMGQAIGHRLFTILVVHPGAKESQRYYSNMPKEYPVGGRKPINQTHWFQRVLGAGQCYIGRSYEDIKDVFFDHELIRSLGCESVINVPVRWNGASIGTINLLHHANYYTEADIAPAEVFAALAAPGLMQVIAAG
jgi:hypothetical protein